MAVFSAIAAVVGTFLSSSLGSALLLAAVSQGVGLVQRALAGKPQKPRFGVEGKLQSGGDLPLSFMMGRGMTAGELVYANTRDLGDNPNAYLVQVIQLGSLPIKALNAMWVDGEKVTIKYDQLETNGYVVEEYVRNDNPKMWVRFYDGTQTDADPLLVTWFSGSTKRPYRNTRVGRGIPYVVVICRIENELFQGFPAFKFEVSGLRLYDISKDTTAGGSGPQRWASPATWGGDGDDLTAVQIYNVLRGISYNGQWIYGLQGLTPARLPAAHWIAEIQKCRAAVPIGGGDTEPAFRSGGEVKVDVEIRDALDEFLTACHGRLAEIGGVYKLHVGEPREPTFAFDDGFLLADEEQSFTPFLGLADSVNGITARYPSPFEGWNMKDANPVYRADLEAEDGGRRLLTDVTFTLVWHWRQIRRLLTYAIKDARRARKHTIVVPADAWEIEPLDTVTWTSPDNGYSGKRFRVDGVMDRPDLTFVVDLTEIDPADFDPAAVTYPPIVENPVVKIKPAAQTVPGFGVTGVTLETPGGSKRPALQLTWSGDLDDIDEIRWEVRLVGGATPVADGATRRVTSGQTIVSGSAILADTTYETRARPVTVGRNRATVWTAWLPALTPNAKLSAGDLYEDAVDWPTLGKDLKDAIAWAGQQDFKVNDFLLNLSARMFDTDMRGLQSVQRLRVEASAAYRDITASYQSAITVAAGEVDGKVTALSQRVDTLEAKIPGLALASALDALQVRVTSAEGVITAQGNAITSLTTTVNGKADASALTALTTRVTTAEGAITAQGQALTSLTSVIDGKASISALNGLTTRVDSVETTANGKNRVFRQNATPIATAAGDLWIKTNDGNKVYVATGTGNASWVLSDDQRIPDLVTTVSAQGNAITSLTTAVDGKASITALSGLTTRVDTVETTANGKNRVYRQDARPTGQSVGDLWIRTDLQNRVYVATATGNTIASWTLSDDQRIPDLVTRVDTQATAITGLQTTVNGKADTSALNTLSTRVDTVETTANGRNRVFRQVARPTGQTVGDLWIRTDQQNKVFVATTTANNIGAWTLSDDQRIPQLVTDVAAVSSSLSSVSARTDRGTASGAIRMEASSGPSDVSSRIAIQASTQSDTGFQAASIFIDVLPANAGTRVAIVADKFVIANGTANNAATASPFVFEAGVLKVREALIPTLTSGLIRSTDGKVRIELDNNRILMAD